MLWCPRISSSNRLFIVIPHVCPDRLIANQSKTFDQWDTNPKMSISQQFPDYELDEVRRVSSPQAIKAMFHPLRGTLLELLLERAATVQELAAAVERPKSSIAYHVGLLAS